MKTIFTIFLAVALTAGLASFMATDAGAITVVANGDGTCSPEELAAGECFVTKGGWTMEIVPVVDPETNKKVFPFYCDGTTTNDVKDVNGRDACKDRRTSITGARFAYIMKAPTAPGSYSLAQANVLCEKCNISKTYPTDNSIQILDRDPNSKYWLPGSSVIAINSLKLDPSNQETIAFWLTLSGAGKKGALLWTGTGPEEVDNILGPICCEATQNITQITVDGSTVNYDRCTGNFTNTTLTPVVGDLWVCWSFTGIFDSKQCNTIKKIGLGSGSFLDVSWDTTDYYSGTRYFGYGNKFFKEYVEGERPTSCIDNGTPSSLTESTIVMDSKAVVDYNSCGDVTSVTGIDGTPASQIILYLFESDPKSGKIDLNTGGPVVNTGGRLGGILDTNPWIYYKGSYIFICC